VNLMAVRHGVPLSVVRGLAEQHPGESSPANALVMS